ncbi:MAG TPA: hypothetical protein VKQ89_05555 [Candidatus Angelobacter sp.]|nr:hypothetical protein [Candidatus Angelobacter sp.]
MPFQCPSCSGKGVEITFAFVLPPTGIDDEVALKTIKCSTG